MTRKIKPRLASASAFVRDLRRVEAPIKSQEDKVQKMRSGVAAFPAAKVKEEESFLAWLRSKRKRMLRPESWGGGPA
jgi:hypothetical protein